MEHKKLIIFLIIIVLVLTGCEEIEDIENKTIKNMTENTTIENIVIDKPKIIEIVENEFINNINISITKATDTRVLVLVEGEYIPAELKIICIHEVSNANIVFTEYTKNITSNENGSYSVEFNREICRAGDIVQVCSIENKTICSNKVKINLIPFKMEFYKYGSGSSNSKTSSIIYNPIGVPEYTTFTGLLLVIMSIIGIKYLRVNDGKRK